MRIFDFFRSHKEVAPVDRPTLGEAAFSNPYHLFAGPPFKEYNPSQLVSRRGLNIFDDMRRDDQIKAAMSFKKHSVLAGGWDINAPEGAPEEWAPKEIVEDTLTKIAGGLENVLLQVLTALDYGYSITERVWDDSKDGVKLSALKTRSPHDFDFISDVFGNIKGLEQNGRALPIDKFIIYSYASEFSNHYGTSDLEAAYRPWWTKDNAYKWMAMLLERMGIPPVFALYNYDDYKGDKLTALKNVLKRMQAATTGIIPRGAGKDSLEMWSPELAGQVSTVFIPAMDMFNRDIARAILMPGLLGATPDEAQGSYARAEVHFDVFMLVIEHIRREVQELVQQQIVEQICAVQVGPLDALPRFEFRPLTDDVRVDLMDEWAKMVGANVVKPQAEDERHIRKQLKFPERDAKDEDFVEPEPTGVVEPPPESPPRQRNMANRGPRLVDFAEVARRLDSLEEVAGTSLKKELRSMRDQLIANLPARLTAANINALELPETRLRARFRALFLTAFEQGQEDIRHEVGVKAKSHAAKPTATPKAALKYLKEKAFWASGILEDDLLKDAKGILMQALRNGEGTAETMHKIQEAWLPYLGDETIIEDEQQLTAPRLETIVRTNVTDAYNHGRLVEMRDPDLEGFISGVEYSAVIDSRTTELCQHLDGKIFREDDPDLDKFTPPNHFNCRSILVPIMVDEPIDAADLITATDKGIALDLMSTRFGGDARYEWDESKHPRDDKGRFGAGGGGETAGDPREFKSPKKDLDAFMDDFWGNTQSHPFDSRIRLQGMVGIEASPHDGKIHISSIISFGEKGAGQASEALTAFTDLADKHQVAISGIVKPIPEAGAGNRPSLNKNQLFKWYERHGFKRLPYYMQPDKLSDDVIRLPQKVGEHEWDESKHPRDDRGRWSSGDERDIFENQVILEGQRPGTSKLELPVEEKIPHSACSGFGDCTNKALEEWKNNNADVYVGTVVRKDRYQEALVAFNRDGSHISTEAIPHSWNVKNGKIIDRTFGSSVAKDHLYFGVKVPIGVLEKLKDGDALANWHMDYTWDESKHPRVPAGQPEAPISLFSTREEIDAWIAELRQMEQTQDVLDAIADAETIIKIQETEQDDA